MNFIYVLFFLAVGCVNQPTVIKNEVASDGIKNTILVDTRSAFEFNGFHISGSINLESINYLILKNTQTKKRILDPDTAQIIERLARRGLSPLKAVILISDNTNSLENKKWSWLLHKLGIVDIKTVSLNEYRATYKNIQQAAPAAMPVWEVKNLFLKKADICFVNFNDKECLR